MNDGKYIRPPDAADKLDAAQRRYIQSKKGKAALRRYFQGRGKEAIRRYHNSEKGKAALARTQQKYYHKRKTELQVAEACTRYLQQNPGKTVEDFLKEMQNGQDISSR